MSTDFQKEHAEVDWRNTIALRNIIAHRYEQVDYEILWDIIQTVLPNLLESLKILLSDFPEPS